jgi:SRSO17 transposase
VGRRAALGAPARRGARADRCDDSRRHQFSEQGTASVGVALQYCGALGKIANCQTAVTVALWTGARAWILGAQLYLPETWLTPAQRTRAQIPDRAKFQEKWRLALTLVRRVRAAGFT